MAKRKYDAVATVGEYISADGEKKKRYMTIGTVFENEKGQLSMKLDGIPVTPDWSGWISFFEPKGRNETPSERPQKPAPSAAESPADDDFPF